MDLCREERMPRERGGVGGRGREELALLDAGNAMVAASAPRRDIAYNPQGRSRGDQQRRGTAGSWGPAHVAGTAQGPGHGPPGGQSLPAEQAGLGAPAAARQRPGGPAGRGPRARRTAMEGGRRPEWREG